MLRLNLRPLWAGAILLLLGGTLAHARPPENQSIDPTTRDWYQSLRQPDTGLLCCSVADCRPTDLRRDPTDPTHWQALITVERYGPSAPNAWVTIPAEVILTRHDNPLGEPIVCWFQNAIRCAVLPSLT